MQRGTQKNINLTKEGISQVSDLRRKELDKIASSEESKKISPSIAHSPNYKKASIASPGGRLGSNSNVDILGPEIYSPLYLLANLNLPRDRVTMNAWNRIFYDTNPIVRNAVNLHSSFPISKINISCKNKQVRKFFEEWMEKIDLYSIVYGVALEYWKLGEVFPYGEIDSSSGVWKRITVLNPDFVSIKKSIIGDETVMSLMPDSKLKSLILSNEPADIMLRQKLPANIVKLVKENRNIPLDAFNISHLKLLSSPYDIRGTSIIVSIYKDLMMLDKIREAKLAQFDGMINPMTVVKLGGDDYKPTQADIDEYRQILEEAQYDKDFKLVTHNGVDISRVGFSGSTLEVNSDIEFIMNNLYSGLMAPKTLFDQEGASYASSSVGLEILRQRYDIFRNMLKKWLERKIFAPMCEMQDFFEYVEGEKRLQVPIVDFNHMNLYDMSDYIQSISNFVSEQKISLQTLYRSLGLSYEDEQKRLREEQINSAIMEKEQSILKTMRLSELKALDPDKPIPEPAKKVESEGGEGAGDSGFSLPGMGGSPMSDMGASEPGSAAPPTPPAGE